MALGRKNYLFAGSDAGGERAASIYSLLGSAKLNGIDPEAYLSSVLRRTAGHPITALRNCCRAISPRPCRAQRRRDEAPIPPKRSCPQFSNRGHNPK